MPNKKNLIGQRFGRLVVVAEAEPTKEGRGKWLCQCDCGKQTEVTTNRLTGGHTKSCGCAIKGVNSIDLTGQRFGRLVVLRPTEKRLGNSVIWMCQCDCGRTATVASVNLRNGSTQSCGCLAQETHHITSETMRSVRKEDYIQWTDVRGLMRRPGSNNTSGVVGVSFDISVGLWKAYIMFQGQLYYLGSSIDKDVVIAYRKEAEQRIHGKFLDWYYSQFPERKPKDSAQPPE